MRRAPADLCPSTDDEDLHSSSPAGSSSLRTNVSHVRRQAVRHEIELARCEHERAVQPEQLSREHIVQWSQPELPSCRIDGRETEREHASAGGEEHTVPEPAKRTARRTEAEPEGRQRPEPDRESGSARESRLATRTSPRPRSHQTACNRRRSRQDAPVRRHRGRRGRKRPARART